MRKQSGVALFAAMIILVILAILSIALLEDSTMDLKMSGAREDVNISNITLQASSVDILANTGRSSFAVATNSSQFTSSTFTDVTSSTEVIEEEVECKRKYDVTTSDIKCKYLKLNLTDTFGRKKVGGGQWGTNVIGVGVEQPIL